MSVDTDRFRLALPPEAWGGKRVLLAGCGGIGSYTASALVRMGLEEIALVDFDRVERVNVATQDLENGLVGEMKTNAVADKLRRINPAVYVRIWSEAFRPGFFEDWNPHVLIVATDSIESREEIVEGALGVLASHSNLELIVDPRMGFEALEVYACRIGDKPDVGELDCVAYLDTLKERDHVEAPCGAQAIAYTGMFAGAVVASVIRRWLNGVSVPVLVTGDIGSYEFVSTWREGEGFEEIQVVPQ